LYFTEAWQDIEQRRSDGSTGQGEPKEGAWDQRQIVWGIRYLDDILLRTDIAASGTEELRYAVQDVAWSVGVVCQRDGRAIYRIAYQAYGHSEDLSPSFDPSENPELDWEVRYAGYVFCDRGRMHIVRNRVLGSQLGAWWQRDPLPPIYISPEKQMRSDASLRLIGALSDEARISLYSYALCSPLNFIDSMGLTADPKSRCETCVAKLKAQGDIGKLIHCAQSYRCLRQSNPIVCENCEDLGYYHHHEWVGRARTRRLRGYLDWPPAMPKPPIEFRYIALCYGGLFGKAPPAGMSTGEHACRILVHELIHAVTVCPPRPDAALLRVYDQIERQPWTLQQIDCAECIAKEALAYLCAGLCKGQQCVPYSEKSCDECNGLNLPIRGPVYTFLRNWMPIAKRACERIKAICKFTSRDDPCKSFCC